MADENGPIVDDALMIPPDSQLGPLGLTDQDVEQYPRMTAYNDKLLYLILDQCRKYFVGVHGTNLQMMAAINGSNSGEGMFVGQVTMFLVKNRIKPMASDVFLLTQLVEETAKRLGDGDIHAVNRRHQLTNEGFLKPTGDDIVPDALRASWIGA